MATTWPGSCPVFMTWPWPWIYIRAWQDLETGLKRTLTFKNSEIISTWHFQSSNNNSTISIHQVFPKFLNYLLLENPKSISSLHDSAACLHVELGGADPQGRVLRPFHQNNFYSSEQLWRQNLQEFQWNINLSIFWDILEFSWRCWVDLGCVRKGGWRGRKNKLVAQERFSVSTDIGGQGKAMQF